MSSVQPEGKNILDRVYSNITNAYRAAPLPHLGLSEPPLIAHVTSLHPPQEENPANQEDNQGLAMHWLLLQDYRLQF